MPPNQVKHALESFDDALPDDLRTLLATIALYDGVRQLLGKHARGERTVLPSELIALDRALAEHGRALAESQAVPQAINTLCEVTHGLIERCVTS